MVSVRAVIIGVCWSTQAFWALSGFHCIAGRNHSWSFLKKLSQQRQKCTASLCRQGQRGLGLTFLPCDARGKRQRNTGEWQHCWSMKLLCLLQWLQLHEAVSFHRWCMPHWGFHFRFCFPFPFFPCLFEQWSFSLCQCMVHGKQATGGSGVFRPEGLWWHCHHRDLVRCLL